MKEGDVCATAIRQVLYYLKAFLIILYFQWGERNDG